MRKWTVGTYIGARRWHFIVTYGSPLDPSFETHLISDSKLHGRFDVHFQPLGLMCGGMEAISWDSDIMLWYLNAISGVVPICRHIYFEDR